MTTKGTIPPEEMALLAYLGRCSASSRRRFPTRVLKAFENERARVLATLLIQQEVAEPVLEEDRQMAAFLAEQKHTPETRFGIAHR